VQIFPPPPTPFFSLFPIWVDLDTDVHNNLNDVEFHEKKNSAVKAIPRERERERGGGCLGISGLFCFFVGFWAIFYKISLNNIFGHTYVSCCSAEETLYFSYLRR